MRAQNDALVRTYTANRTHRYRNRKKNLRVSSARRFDRPRVRGGGWSHACCIVGHRAQLLPEEGLAGKKLLLRGGGRLRLLFPSARGGFLRLHRGGGFQRLEPGVEKRRPRLGQARGAITVSAFLDIVPAGVVPLAGKSALVAQQARGVGIVVGEFLERAQGPGHRLLGLVASLADCSGVLLELGAIGTPQTAGARLAVGRLKDAGGDLRRDEDRAVENVECEGTGRHADLIALEPVGTLLARRLDRLLADDVDDAALRGVGDALAGQSQLVDLQRLAGAGDLKQPRLAV